jgi:hypothetical protein
LITGENVFARWIDCENKGYIGHYKEGRNSRTGADFDEERNLKWKNTDNE